MVKTEKVLIAGLIYQEVVCIQWIDYSLTRTGMLDPRYRKEKGKNFEKGLSK